MKPMQKSLFNLFLIVSIVLINFSYIFGQNLYQNNEKAYRDFNEMGSKIPTSNDIGWLQHYLTGYYSRWESEANQTNIMNTGVKHRYGQSAMWKGVQCWSSEQLTFPADSLIYGPHYFQEKKYKRLYYGNHLNVGYIARYRMALNYDPLLVSPEDEVCRIKVVYSYVEINSNTKYDSVFLKKTLKVSDFPVDGSFKFFNFDFPYQYLSAFLDAPLETIQKNIPKIKYSDKYPGTGIQFCVDWLGKSTTTTLYVDYTEVYDDNGWDRYIGFPGEITERMKEYICEYLDWKYIPFLSSRINFTTIDEYIPVKTIDSLFRSVGAPPILPENLQYQATLNPELEVPYQRIQKVIQGINLITNKKDEEELKELKELKK